MLWRGEHDILYEHGGNLKAASLDHGFGFYFFRSCHFQKDKKLSHFFVQNQCRTQITFIERCRKEENIL